MLDKNITDFFSNNIITLVSLIASTIVAACIEFWIQYGDNTRCFYYSTKCLNTKEIDFANDIPDETKLSILEYAYPANMKFWPYQECIYKKKLNLEIQQTNQIEQNQTSSYEGGSNGKFISNEAFEKEYNGSSCIYKPISDYSSYDGKPFPYNVADFAEKYVSLTLFKSPLKAFSFYFLYNVICIRYLIKKVFKLLFYGINHFKVLDSNVKSNLLFIFLLAFGIIIFFGGFIGLIVLVGMFAFIISLFYTTSSINLGRELEQEKKNKYYFMNNPYIYRSYKIDSSNKSTSSDKSSSSTSASQLLKYHFFKYYLISIGIKHFFNKKKLFFPPLDDVNTIREYNNNMTFYPLFSLNYIKYRFSINKNEQYNSNYWKEYIEQTFKIQRNDKESPIGKRAWAYIIAFSLFVSGVMFLFIEIFQDVKLWINIVITLIVFALLLGINYSEDIRLSLPLYIIFVLYFIFYFILNIFTLFYLFLLIILILTTGVFSNILSTIYMSFSFVFNTFYIPLSHPLELFSIIRKHAKLLIIILLISVAVNASFKLYETTAGLIGGLVALIVLYTITNGYNKILS